MSSSGIQDNAGRGTEGTEGTTGTTIPALIFTAPYPVEMDANMKRNAAAGLKDGTLYVACSIGDKKLVNTVQKIKMIFTADESTDTTTLFAIPIENENVLYRITLVSIPKNWSDENDKELTTGTTATVAAVVAYKQKEPIKYITGLTEKNVKIATITLDNMDSRVARMFTDCKYFD